MSLPDSNSHRPNSSSPDWQPGTRLVIGVLLILMVVILLFASGKLVCTGAKKEEDVYTAVDKLHKRLEEEELIYYEET